MASEIIVPSPGESITQVQVAKWLVSNGEEVEKDQEVVEIDSDKASFPLMAPADGILNILVPEGETVAVGTILARVESAAGSVKPVRKKTAPVKDIKPPVRTKDEIKAEKSRTDTHISPLADKIRVEKKIAREDVFAAFEGKRIGKKEIESFVARKESPGPAMKFSESRSLERRKLSTLRLKLAERLVAVKNETAMLTTFNEVNMRNILEIKEKHNDLFKEKFGVGIGFMSFFSKAVTLALKEFPQVNSMLDGEDLVIPGFVDMSIAVSAPKGLVVPVIRDADKMSIPELEIRIKELAVKARENRITLEDMKGGTFTITNGGVFGSMMSTPILNPPQSAILGMHKIMDRPIAVNGKVEIQPMMYIALSYDHRVIDGRESVTFLVKVKEYIEDPVRMVEECKDPVKRLLEI
ncbi:MAG: 2-oxoglutarate dehydrogenase complex dihydrolipoyllysine-residue succinyltransferase [Bacteroidetes bacterium]|nr:2-oxoglutarate dehydrogenase complex dihydrolipoyllysine-residue succinyltransferase [Bacteroidota bacterium]